MEKIHKRFKYCDARFLPYIEQVLNRVPPEIKHDILGNQSFQILAGDDFHETCMLQHKFETPIETMVYLNTKILNKSEHHIILAIASQIAGYCVNKSKPLENIKEAEGLLMSWGFGEELQAVRYTQALANSAAYRTGYKWARNQNKDYLLQHFGLYRDERYQKAWAKQPQDLIQIFDQDGDKTSILEEISTFKEIDVDAPAIKAELDDPSSKHAIIAGIMAAVKEIELLEQNRSQKCESLLF